MSRRSSRSKKPEEAEEAEEAVEVESTHVEKITTTTTTRIKKKTVTTRRGTAKAVVKSEGGDGVKKVARKRKLSPEEEEVGDEKDSDDYGDEPAEDKKKPAPKKRKTTRGEKQEDMSLAARTAVSSLKRAMYIGAHVSGAGGVQNSIANAQQIGANAFAVFLKNQRKWTSPPMAAEVKSAFVTQCKQHDYDAAQHVLPHGSYLINLAQADDAKADTAYGCFLDDLERCEALGIKLYNFHPGSSGGADMKEATDRIAAQLNKAHKATRSVTTVIENMCGAGNVVGAKFEELRDIIEQVEDKSRVGVCIDTCHAFAAGYDLRSPEAFLETMAKFDAIVGLKYLKALHLNDSQAPLGGLRDRHANIGTGFLGLQAFHNVVNYEPFQKLPMVLETPIEEKGANGKSFENKQIWADEIKLLERLIGADLSTAEWQAKAEELQAKGAADRKKIQDEVDKKSTKDAKNAGKKAKKDAKTASASI